MVTLQVARGYRSKGIAGVEDRVGFIPHRFGYFEDAGRRFIAALRIVVKRNQGAFGDSRLTSPSDEEIPVDFASKFW